MIRSQDNVVTGRDERRYQDVSVNIEKSIQEETTSSSYVDAKNCFVQDAYTQSVCKNVGKGIDDFGENDEGNESSNRINKIDYIKEIISNDNSTDRLSFNLYNDAEKIDDKYDGIISNREHECKENVDAESSTCCLVEENKSSTIATRTISKNYTDLPYVPGLVLKEKCDCTAASCNCEYRFSNVRIEEDNIEGTNEFDISMKCDRETIGKIFKQNRTLDAR